MPQIHFDFIVDEVDAENIMDCIHSEICRCIDAEIPLIAEQHSADGRSEEDLQALRKAYRNRAEYLKELKKKMTNARVED